MNTWIIIALIVAAVIVFGIVIYALMARKAMKMFNDTQKHIFDEFNKF